MLAWRRGHYEALDVSRKSLPGDKVLIFSMCKSRRSPAIFQSQSLKWMCPNVLFVCLRCSFVDFKWFSTCLTSSELVIHLPAQPDLALKADGQWAQMSRRAVQQSRPLSLAEPGLTGSGLHWQENTPVTVILMFFVWMFWMLSALLSDSPVLSLCCVPWAKYSELWNRHYK